jgi:hypothetical protein
MNRWVRLFAVIIGAGLAAFLITRKLAPTPAPTSELTWLATEFSLSPTQAAKIQALHDAYTPLCAQHCASILDTKSKIATARSPALKTEAQVELQHLIATCHDSTQAHLQAVAAAMEPTQGQRYLAMIGPRLSAHQHAEPFGFR